MNPDIHYYTLEIPYAVPERSNMEPDFDTVRLVHWVQDGDTGLRSIEEIYEDDSPKQSFNRRIAKKIGQSRLEDSFFFGTRHFSAALKHAQKLAREKAAYYA